MNAGDLVFDVLRLDFTGQVDDPLEHRRATLEQVARTFDDTGRLRLSPATTSRVVAERWFDGVGGALDGIIAKKLG